MLCFNTAATLQLSQNKPPACKTGFSKLSWHMLIYKAAQWCDFTRLDSKTDQRRQVAWRQWTWCRHMMPQTCTEAIWLCRCRFNKLICLYCASAVLSVPSSATGDGFRRLSFCLLPYSCHIFGVSFFFLIKIVIPISVARIFFEAASSQPA